MPTSRLLARWLARSGETRPAVQDATGVTSWRDLIGAADRVATALLDGRRSLDGERVALLVSPGAGGRDTDTGELWIAGPSVFAGYHERPAESRESFVVEGRERWFKTGDTVARAADGYVRVLGRTSVDILKSGGYKLSALEIEEALREHSAVAEVAIVGVPDATWGESVVACVVPREGRDEECSQETLRAFAKDRLAACKVPRRVVVMRELPRNALGKVMKPELLKRLS